MQKAFDRVLGPTIWCSLRKKNNSGKHVDIIAHIYRNCSGQTKAIVITERVHQDSVLSPYLFCLMMDTLTEHA